MEKPASRSWVARRINRNRRPGNVNKTEDFFNLKSGGDTQNEPDTKHGIETKVKDEMSKDDGDRKPAMGKINEEISRQLSSADGESLAQPESNLPKTESNSENNGDDDLSGVSSSGGDSDMPSTAPKSRDLTTRRAEVGGSKSNGAQESPEVISLTSDDDDVDAITVDDSDDDGSEYQVTQATRSETVDFSFTPSGDGDGVVLEHSAIKRKWTSQKEDENEEEEEENEESSILRELLKQSRSHRMAVADVDVMAEILPYKLGFSGSLKIKCKHQGSFDFLYREYFRFAQSQTSMEGVELKLVNKMTGKVIEPFSSIYSVVKVDSQIDEEPVLQLVALAEDDLAQYQEELFYRDSDGSTEAAQEPSAATEPQKQEPVFTFKVKGADNVVVTCQVTANTSILKIADHYREMRNVPSDKQIRLTFDDELLEGAVCDNEALDEEVLEDEVQIDAHIR